MMRSFHEAIDIPFRDVCDAVRPELKHEVDVGDGVGGLITILHLIYSALLLQDEAHAKAHDAEKKKKKRHSLVKKDISELQKYEEQNTEYVDVEELLKGEVDPDHIHWNKLA